MSTFSWVLVVVGAFLAIYAASVLAGRQKVGDDGKGRTSESLGCGFVLLAGAFWGIALARYLGDWQAGLQLGIAGAILLPVVATLLGRGKSGIVRSVVMLAIAVALGASALPKLTGRLKPTKSGSTVQNVESAVADLKTQIENTRTQIGRLRGERKLVKSKVSALKFDDFAAISKAPKGYALLKELEDIDQMVTAAAKRLPEQENLLVRLEAAQRRIKRHADAEAAGVELDEKEIQSILEEARQKPTTAVVVTVEEHVERAKLEKLFESEF